MDEENKIKNSLNSNPLFMPPGSVRAIIAIGLVLGTVYAWLTEPANVPEGMVTLAFTVVAFYFGAKKVS